MNLPAIVALKRYVRASCLTAGVFLIHGAMRMIVRRKIENLQFGARILSAVAIFLALFAGVAADASPFTTNVPGTSLVLPAEYPEAGGVAIVMVGANGNAYYQFSNPTGAFVGFQNTGNPAAFRGNPFTINNPISLNCGYSSCSTYFGGSIANVYIRFTAQDGDTQVGGFDENDITLRLNGFDISNWSGVATQATDTAGTTVFSSGTGFGNNTFDTGWFSSTNPALLANILSTGKTTSQIFDRDPNDNYWDFSIGNSLSNASIVTVAPGYSLTKTANPTTFTAVGQVINYTYNVANIGSVSIRQLTLSDNKIANVTCNKTVINAVPFGAPAPDSAVCTASYTITQADFDAEKVVNIAKAVGVPDYGTLGGLTATATVTGPVTSPAISLAKSSSLASFGAVGTTVPYAFRVQNTGNATLTNVVVSDPKVPGLSCTFATLAPAAIQNCAASYIVTQADVDAFALGNNLQNTANVTSRDPKNVARNATSGTVSLPGAAPVVTMFLDKTTTATAYATVGQVLPYQILVRNTGTVTWPVAPTVTDSKTAVSCPAGAVAPGASITCTANYTVVQADIDAGSILNTASGTITVGSRTATANDAVTLNATRTTGLTIAKRLAAASPTSFDNSGIALSYVYDLRNSGNVTLNTLVVSDNKVAVSCPVTTIAPGATVSCTSAAYATTQADLNAGSVTNTANATAKAAGTAATVAAGPTNLTVPAVQRPALTLAKTAPVVVAVDYTVGRVVQYSFTVTNSGNTDMLAAPQLTITDDKIGTFNCGAGTLARGASRTCTANYTLTSADVNAGLVANKATANAGPVASNQATAKISPTLNPGLTLAKSASPATVSATTNLITYTFTLTNSGNSQIQKAVQPITVSDPLPGLSANNCAAQQPATLNAGASFTCTATYNPTQANLDAGRINNTAAASFPFTSGGVTTTISAPSASAVVNVTETTGLTLDKSGPVEFTAVGQVITYGFSVTNTGNTTLTTVAVTDPRLPGLVCNLTNIAPAAVQSCAGATRNYTVTQADMDAGNIVNTASAKGRTASGGAPVGSDTNTVPVATSVVLKRATFQKVANKTNFAAVGETITYTMQVANTGAQTLRNITVTDALNAAFSCAIPVVLPGVTNSSCTYVYTVTQADFNAGRVINNAAAASADFATLTSTVTVTGPARTAAFTFAKAASGPFVAAGNVVTFSFSVKNTGNVTLTNVAVSDPFFDPDLTCAVASLAPGATDSTCSANYTVTQADVDAGSITNTASASAVPPSGVAAPAAKTATVVVNGPTSAPTVQITKVASQPTYAAVGNVISYTFSVKNTGNVTLSNLVVSDPALAGFSCALANLAPGATATTCSGGAPLQASKTITQAEIDLGAFANTASVTGQSLIGGASVSDDDRVVVTGPVQAPTISMVKASTLVGNYSTVGQSVPYTYTITNTGNITLTGVFTVADNKIAKVTCPAPAAAGVPPGGNVVCTGSYKITQADLNAGQVVNLATATIVQPVIPANPGDPAVATVNSAQVSETVTAAQQPALSLQKRVKSSSAASYDAVGDVVIFEYVVTNTGNVTTTAPITIADDKIPGTLSCAAAGVAPGAVVICEQNWTADLAALNAGQVTNSAIASTVYGGSTTASPADTATVTAVQMAKLAVVKTFTGTTAPGLFNVGDTLSYTIVVTNTGNVSVNGPITLTDSLTTPVCPALPGNILKPAAGATPADTLNCTATHVVTQNDVDLGSATNVVSAAGSFGGSPVVSPSDNAVYPLAASPALSLTKAAVSGAIPFTAAGQTVTYRYTVKNTGNVALSAAIYITDDKLGGGARLCRPAGPFNTTDAPFSCNFVYTITQADVDLGSVTNNAVASTVYAPSGAATAVVSPNADATVAASENPQLTVTKAVTAGPNPATAGDVLTYTITTTNSGNQTISGVKVTDAKIGALACTVGGAVAPANVVLAPTQALICSATYTVKQTDLDAQVLTNTAAARGSDPQGATVSTTGSNTHPLATPAPAVQVTKAISPPPGPDDAFSTIGQTVTFVVTVKNTGNITLASSTVTDDRVAGSCTVGPLAPGQEDSSCEFVFVVTQAEIDSGGFVNTAAVSAQPANPGAPLVTDTGDVFAKGPERVRALALAKSSLTADFDAVGDVITYKFVVANIGNVTLLQNATVTDPLLGTPFVCGAFPPGGLLPGDFVECQKTYTVKQADVDAGTFVNVATVASPEVPLLSPPGPMQSTATVNANRTPAMTVDKTASKTTNVVVGDVLTYSYKVKNTGNVTLTAVAPADQHTSAAGTVALTVGGETLTLDAGVALNSTDAAVNGVWDTLSPGDQVTFRSTYTVTQADVDVGAALANTVNVSAGSPAGTTPPAATDTLSVPVIAPAPRMVSIKTADSSGFAVPPVVGNPLVYTITVNNTGNVTLAGLSLSDTLKDAAGVAILPALVPVLVSGDTDADGKLDVAEIWTYRVSYALTQQALDAGGVSNSVLSAATTPAGAPVSDVSDNDGTGPSDPTVTALQQLGRITLVKAASVLDGGDGRVDVGDKIRYVYTVRNRGNVTLFDLALVETGFTGSGITPVPLRQSGGANLGGNGAIIDLAVAGTAIYQVDYTLTQADLDAGGVNNQGTVTAKKPDGISVQDRSGGSEASNAATVTSLAAVPALDVQKRANISALSSPVAAGDIITYTITAENTGNVTLSNVVPTDTLKDANGAVLGLSSGPTLISGDADGDAKLGVTEIWTYRATYALSQAAIDAGGVANSVVIATKTPKGVAVQDTSDDDGSGPSDPTVTNLAPVRSMKALKTANTTGLSSPPAVGDVLTYTITLQNTGNITLDTVQLVDTLTNGNGTARTLTTGPTLVSGDTNSNTKLDVGETWRHTATYKLRQADVDSGQMSNSVLAKATAPGGTPVTDVSDNGGSGTSDPTVTPLTRTPAVTVEKTAKINGVAGGRAKSGDVIVYTYTVTNTGNTVLSAVTLDDQHTSAAGTAALIIAGDTLASDQGLTGNSTDAADDGVWDTLGPKDVVTFSASYTVTQADGDAAAALRNTVLVVAQSPAGTTPPSATDTLSVPVAVPTPVLQAVKTVDLASLSNPPVAGEVVNFTIKIANTGNQTLRNVVLQDTLQRLDTTVLTLDAGPSYVSGDTGVADVLEIGQIWTYSASYTLTQADVDAGGISNQVLATSRSPSGVLVSDLSDDGAPGGANDPTRVLIASTPRILGEKTITAGPVVLGGTVEFLITATNAGNVTLTSVGVASDSLRRADGTALTLTSAPGFVGASEGSAAGVLVPGEVASYTASYVLVQADIDAGGIANSAVVRGTPPAGGPVTDVTDNGDDADGNTTGDPTKLVITADPALALEKRLATGSGPTFDAAGDVLQFEFEVTNTGNVTITDPVRIADAKITAQGGIISCAAGPLAPGASLLCAGAYTVTQADVDAGAMTNTASASDGTTVSDPASRTVLADQKPALTTNKTAVAVPAASFVTGAVVTYSYKVTNTGNVTIVDAVRITDNRIAASAISCPALPPGGLRPAAVLTCRGTYTVTADDVDLGSVTNLASATDGTTTSPVVSETIPDVGTPALSIVKTAAAGATFAAVGDTIGYRYRVTNTGTRAFVAPVKVFDDRVGEIACFTPTPADRDFKVGEQVICTATYTVTQADLDLGRVTNQAYARTTFGGGSMSVVSDPDTVVVTAGLTPQLTLTKSSAPNPVATVGQVVTYSLTATNSGNQTLRNVEVNDPLLPTLACSVAVLPPGQALACTAPYTILQADVDRGTLVNTAAVQGVTPQGAAVRDTATETTAMPTAAPALTLVKTAVPSPFGGVGSTLTYGFAATNTGNVTIKTLVVTDPVDATFRCTVALLAPGATDDTCRLSVTVTQAQVDAGQIDNTAKLTGRSPSGALVTTTDSISTAGPAQLPQLNVTKVVLPSATSVGSVVRYQLAVENTGNVTLIPDVPLDVMTRLDGVATALDTAFALTSGDANGDSSLDLSEVWIYQASHVLTQDDVDAGGLSNTASVTALAPGGASVVDVSDNGNDADGNSTDDPTRFVVVPGPALTVTKVVSAQQGSAVGDRVTFTITALNTGDVTLTGLSIVDRMTRADGTPIGGIVPVGGAASLLPGASALWTIVYRLTQADIDAGGISNSADVSGKPPTGPRISDQSADGDITDGNTTDDPTVVVIRPAPGLSVIKKLNSIGAAVGELAKFTITATNTGTVSLSNVAITDNLTRLDSSVIGSQTPVFVGNSAGSTKGSLAVGEVASWTLSYVLTQADLNAGGLSNTATATARTPLGVNVQDISDDDGVGGDDPTLAPIAAVTSFAVVKSASKPALLFPTVERVAFTLTVKNTGNVTQSGIKLVDDLTGFLAPARLVAAYPVDITAQGFSLGAANPAYDGVSITQTLTGDATLAPGQTGTVKITLVYSTLTGVPAGANIGRVTSRQNTTPTPSNPVRIIQTDSDGDGISDGDEGGGDRDGDGIANAFDYDPTGTFYCEDNGKLLSGGRVSVTGPGGSTANITIVRDGSDGRFQFYVTAAGSYRLAISYPPSGVKSTTRLSAGSLDLTSLLPANPASVGSGENGSTGVLVDFSAGANTFYTTIEVAEGDPFLINNNIPMQNCAAGSGPVVASKTADRSTAVFGETVNYTLVFENKSSGGFAGATLVDQLPAGLIYTPGSGVVNGVATDPAARGARLEWGPLNVASGSKITVKLAARVASGSVLGKAVNSTFMLDAGGAQVSNTATAVIKIQPEAVFDCSDVIGKVFDDRNHNGYQDGPNGLPPLTDDDVFVGGKYGKFVAAKPVDKNYEPGLPGVRLVTVNGLLITTDDFGRFHVPCAALPGGTGANFTLKVDPRTLPQGYILTTENPRVLRLTAGKLAKMNFGAALTNIIDIDLTGAAFAAGSDQPNSGFVKAIKQLVQDIQSKPTALRLSYLLRAGENMALANDRLRGAERLIRNAWRGVGAYKLDIERVVKQVQ